jgi:hypothetical protein
MCSVLFFTIRAVDLTIYNKIKIIFAIMGEEYKTEVTLLFRVKLIPLLKCYLS